ncbi:MAG: MipA/OmpV family protein [Gammaproteobacteria bacterium]|nr:MipA/OmpV family protein [Gammaproteobacteria bacterium]
MQHYAPRVLATVAAAFLAVGVFFGSVSVRAEEPPKNFIPNFIGLGVGVTPEYSGSDDYVWGAAPGLYYQFKDSNRFIEWYGPVADMNLLDSPTWQVGPILAYQFGRNDVDDDVIARLSDVDGTIEGGLIVSYTHNNFEGIPWRLRVGAQVLGDLGDVYSGTHSSLWANFWFPISHRAVVGIGGGASWASSSFNRAYYGISSRDSLASGLPAFNPGGGLTQWYAWPAVVFQITPEWYAGAGLLYQRISGDAADSPIVKHGDANQVSGGVGVGYAWK